MSGSETGGFDQTNLVAARCEFPALITLNHDTTPGFDPDDTGTDPAEGGGFQHLDHISRLKIHLHVRIDGFGTK